mgnify:CR=1 FL=1
MLYSLRPIRLLALLTLSLPTLFALATQSHAQDLPIPPSAERICTLIAEAQSGKILLEAGDCDTRVTPASTFKLPLAVMGFDSGFLESPDAPSLPFRQGDPDWGGAAWRQRARAVNKSRRARAKEDFVRKGRASGYAPPRWRCTPP